MPDTAKMLRLDHLVVIARTLDIGVDHVRKQLGIPMAPGGKHTRMGTHNCLLKLGEREYLEVIAIDPDARPPDRPRWFGMDDPLHADARLATWALASNDIAATLRDAIPEAGEAVEMVRGDLRWLIAIAPDGKMPMDGAFPGFIQWPKGVHPSQRMPDMGCALHSLTIRHPHADRIRQALAPHLHDERIVIEPADRFSMSASIQTPAGIKYLD